ncbi:hypothetical protein D4R51_00495 [bacterium]|nr:MAG: hypothetical protein D4R51_00495 [bacterium]
MRNDRMVYFTILIFAFMVLGGFYLVFDKLSTLGTEVKNNELNLQLFSKNNNPSSASSPETPAATTQPNAQNQNPPANAQTANDIIVPTGIIFSVNSSAALQPQTSVMITIESVTKKSDGTVLVSIKAFTNQAMSYSTVDTASFLQYVSLDSENQFPANISAVFNSMPPKSVVTGTATFRVDPGKNIIILQTGQGDNPKFYEINFGTGTYKETTIG